MDNTSKRFISFDSLPIAVSQVMDKLDRIELMLSKPADPPQKARYDFKGTLDYLSEIGYPLSKSKLQKLTASGSIPCQKFYNRLVFDRAKLDKWVESQTEAVGENSAALTLARSANRKLRRA